PCRWEAPRAWAPADGRAAAAGSGCLSGWSPDRMRREAALRRREQQQAHTSRPRVAGNTSVASLLFLRRSRRGRRHRQWTGGLRAFQRAGGPIGGRECSFSHAQNVRFRDLVVAVELAEQFVPVSEARLERGELRGHSRVAVQAAQQVRFGARLETRELLLGDRLRLQPFNLLVDSFLQLPRRVAGRG